MATIRCTESGAVFEVLATRTTVNGKFHVGEMRVADLINLPLYKGHRDPCKDLSRYATDFMAPLNSHLIVVLYRYPGGVIRLGDGARRARFWANCESRPKKVIALLYEVSGDEEGHAYYLSGGSRHAMLTKSHLIEEAFKLADLQLFDAYGKNYALSAMLRILHNRAGALSDHDVREVATEWADVIVKLGDAAATKHQIPQVVMAPFAILLRGYTAAHMQQKVLSFLEAVANNAGIADDKQQDAVTALRSYIDDHLPALRLVLKNDLMTLATLAANAVRSAFLIYSKDETIPKSGYLQSHFKGSFTAEEFADLDSRKVADFVSKHTRFTLESFLQWARRNETK
jgi:hypothetical protein